jgi:hypothetical protein
MALYTLKFPNVSMFNALAQAQGFWDTENAKHRSDDQRPDPAQGGKIVGANLTYCGPEILSPAVVDSEGNVVTPAVMSTEVFAIMTAPVLPANLNPRIDPRGYGYSGHLFAGTVPGPHPA